MLIEDFDGDLLGLEGFADRLEKFIQVEHGFVHGSLVLALSSSFGTGKTTFLTMWRKRIRGSDKNRFDVVDLNAWISDYYGDPLFAIVSALLDHIPNKNGRKEKIKDAAKVVGRFSFGVANQLVATATGVDVVAAVDYAESGKSEPYDAFSGYRARKDAMEGLKEAIRDYINSVEGQVLFLVDELDRCRPDYAISYLETIKHIFDMDNAVFILAADRDQLENSAKSAFGPDLNFDEYFRKFIHREVTLPPVTEDGYEALAAAYTEAYLSGGESRTCIAEFDSMQSSNIQTLISKSRLSPRQTQEVFRVLGHLLSRTEPLDDHLEWAFASGAIFMCVLRISHPKTYKQLGADEFTAEEGKTFLLNLLGKDALHWWFKLILSGCGFSDARGGQEDFDRALRRFKVGGGKLEFEWSLSWSQPQKSRFQELYRKIEHVYDWT